MKIDGKFSCDGEKIFNTVSGEAIPQDEPLFLLRARDRNALVALSIYRDQCKRDGCNDLHLAWIDKVRYAFSNYAETRPDRMKEPGITRHLKLEAE